MRFRLNSKNDNLNDLEETCIKLRDCCQRLQFSQQSIRTLLDFMTQFSLDIKEIQSEAFKASIDELTDVILSEENLKKIQSIFDKHKKKICRYIERQNKYIQDREKELKDIIELLGKALVTLDSENQEYNQKIYEQSEKIEQITRLDDIKRIKLALAKEIEQIRATIRNKQSYDTAKMEKLVQKVSFLDQELKKARSESVTDSLTGVHNRRAFDRHITDLAERNTGVKSSFTLLMLDIDNFKNVNDTHGHRIGDRVLLALAQKCGRMIRNGDFIARYGGEEFMIILPNTSLNNSIVKAQAICDSIAATRYALEDAPPGQTLSITVSIGVSVCREGDTAANVIERADEALYLAKRLGKNRVASELDLKSSAPLASYALR